jgi:hypothetical protein
MSEEQKPTKSFLEDKLERLDAVYQKYGRDGLKDHTLSDVTTLLAAKQLRLRDAPKGREIGEQQQQENRMLELEVRDLSSYVDAHLAGANLTALQKFVRGASQQNDKPQFKPKERGFDKDR